MEKKMLKCPICQRKFSLQKRILIHIAKHHPIGNQQMILENGGSSAAPVDLLPWKIRTRRRGSNNMALLEMEAPARNEIIIAAAEPQPPTLMMDVEAPGGNEIMIAAAEPPPPPPPPPPAGNRMELVLYDENQALDLPLKKRLIFIRAAARNLNRYICHICGRVYTKGSALGGHKAQHTIADRKREKQRAAGAMVVHVPLRRPDGYQCQRCGRVFSSGQGLGGHKRHCKGAQRA